MTRMQLVIASFTIPMFAACVGTAGDAVEDADEIEYGTATSELSVFQWSADQTISNQFSSDAPALGAYSGKVHLVRTAPSGTALYHSSYDGTSWTPSVLIPNQFSMNRPALAAFGPKGSHLLHMVHQGDTTTNLWWSVYDGVSWTANSAIGMSSSLAPAMEAYNGVLHLFGTSPITIGSTTSYCLWEATYNGTTWSSPLFITTAAGARICPAGFEVKLFGSTPVMVARFSSNNLYTYTFTGGVWSAGAQIAGQKSKSAPALGVYGGVLHMTHLGDTSDSIWWSTYDGASWSSNVTIPNQASRWVPALAPLSNKLVQAHIASSGDQLWFSTFQ